MQMINQIKIRFSPEMSVKGYGASLAIRLASAMNFQSFLFVLSQVRKTNSQYSRTDHRGLLNESCQICINLEVVFYKNKVTSILI